MMRRDKRGRRIGRNWWREHNHDLWFWANAAWEQACEAAAAGYSTETGEYASTNPRPKFKDFLIAHKGMTQECA